MYPARTFATASCVQLYEVFARADGLNKGMRYDLACTPWCLFNLTDDIGERIDLGSNPAYQDIAEKIAARLAYHGSTGPMPAYIWPTSAFPAKVDQLCANARKTGYVEPLDLDSQWQSSSSSSGGDISGVTLLDRRHARESMLMRVTAGDASLNNNAASRRVHG